MRDKENELKLMQEQKTIIADQKVKVETKFAAAQKERQRIQQVLTLSIFCLFFSFLFFVLFCCYFDI